MDSLLALRPLPCPRGLPWQQRQVYCAVGCKMSILKQTGSFCSWCLPSATKLRLWSGWRRKAMTMRRMMNWTSLGVMTASRATTAAWAVTAAPVWRSLVMMRWQTGKLESFRPLRCTSHPQAGSQKTVAPSQVRPVLPETRSGAAKVRGCTLGVLWEQFWIQTAFSGLCGGSALYNDG